jgi:hypothetical protein
MALDLLPRYEQRVNSDKNPFATAIRLAIAGNVIDLATRDDVPESELLTVIEKTLAAALPTTTLESLEQAISSASRILFLADNAGEIVFDRPLLNLLPRDKITLAVRGGPILNDATLVEARASGLQDLVSIVDNGSAIPGTWLPDCSEEFQRIYDQADLLISKGQGNFETLWGRTSIPTFFLFRVKCEGIQARVHSPVDTDMLLQG